MTSPRVLTPQSFGPFTKGVVDTANPKLNLTGALRYARGLTFTGLNKFSLRPGTAAVLTLQDDTRAVTSKLTSTTVSSATLTTVTHTSAGWTVDAYKTFICEIISGPGAGQRAVISGNTADTLTVGPWNDVPALQVAPTSSSHFIVYSLDTPPAAVTRVCLCTNFADGALAVAYSSTTQIAYLYSLTSTMDGWTDSSGVLHQGSLEPEPFGQLWSSMPVAPEVTMAEGLGVAYVAHTLALDAVGLYWPTMQFNGSAITAYTADLNNSGTPHDVYFTSVQSFQQALWGFGFGSGTTAANGYRPELARFSPPDFDVMQASDSITLGDRVRSARERVLGSCVAGEALIMGGSYMVSRVTGFDRDSWVRTPLDRSHGFVNHKCFASDGEFCYYWSKRGPMRVTDATDPEPLWMPIQDLVTSVINPQNVVCGRDEARDLILWIVDTGNGVRQRVAYDTARGLFSSTDDDWGLVLNSAGEVDPIIKATATPPITVTSTAAPTAPVTSYVGTTTAQANWTAGDLLAETLIFIQRTADAAPTLVATLPAGVQSYFFTGLLLSTQYEWSVQHLKNGVLSTLLGPSGATTFTTLAPGAGLNEPLNLQDSVVQNTVTMTWDNSGETDAQTEVWLAGPSLVAPAPGNFILIATVDPGVGSYTFEITQASATPTQQTYWVEIRHVRSGSSPSVFVGPLGAVVTGGLDQ